jgi:hypothetical protein
MTEREEFERWAAKRVGLSQDGRVNYAYGATRDAWEVWQARAELGTPHCTKKLNALHANYIALQAECEALRLKAARYDALAAMAHQTTAYDRLGNGGHWSIGFHSKDNHLSFGEALDAMGKEKA